MAETWEQLLDNLSVQNERDISSAQEEVDADLDAAYETAKKKLVDAGTEFHYWDAPLLQQIARTSIADSGVERIRLIMERMIDNEESVLEKFTGVGLSPTQERALAAAKDLNTAWVDDLTASLQPTIRNLMASAVQRPVSVVEVADAFRAELQGPTRTAARALAELHLKMLDRIVIDDYGKNQGFNWLIYLGPDDRATRVFCEHTLTWAFQVEDIYLMDNGMLPNCLLTCGGWGCRHNWRRISELVLHALYPRRQVLAYVQTPLIVGKRTIIVLEPTEVA